MQEIQCARILQIILQVKRSNNVDANSRRVSSEERRCVWSIDHGTDKTALRRSGVSGLQAVNILYLQPITITSYNSLHPGNQNVSQSTQLAARPASVCVFAGIAEPLEIDWSTRGVIDVKQPRLHGALQPSVYGDLPAACLRLADMNNNTYKISICIFQHTGCNPVIC